MGQDAGYLTRQAEEAAAAVKALVEQLDRTGDESLKKDIRKEQRKLRESTRLLKEIVPDVAPEGVKSGTAFGGAFVDSAAKAIASGNPYVTGSIIGLAGASAPLLGGAIAAAVLGGVGAGGIAGGIALAAQDSRVRSAADQVGQMLTEELQDAAEPFVEPLLRSLGKIGSAGLGTRLSPAFEELAKSIDPLTDGLLVLVDNAMPGLIAATKGAGPVLATFSDELGDIGTAASKMFALMASDPEGAQDAVRALGGAIEVTLTGAGLLVGTLTSIYGKVVDIGQAVGVINDDPIMKVIPRGSTQDVVDFGKSMEEAAAEAKTLNDAIAALFGQTLGAKEATLAYEQAVDDLKEELTDGKRTLDEGTQAGRDNWSAINDMARAIEDLRQANIKNNMPIAQANALYEKQITDLQKTMVNLGYNSEAAKKYTDQLKGIPKSLKTTIVLDFATNAAAAILGAAKIAGERASGGPVVAGRTYLVGERGPELLQMGGASGHVFSNGQSAAMMSGASGGSVATIGAQVIRLVIDLRGDDEEQVRRIRKQVEVLGGGNVQVAFGSS
jgi:hypothetical protein